MDVGPDFFEMQSKWAAFFVFTGYLSENNMKQKNLHYVLKFLILNKK